jgi:predicted MFS family arabinose efflux permease
LVTGLVFLWRYGVLRRITFVDTVHNAVFSAVPLLVVVIGLRQQNSSLSIGLVYALTGAGSLVGALAATGLSRRLSPRRAVLITCWVPAVLLAFSALFPSLEVLAVALTAGCLVSPPADAVLVSVRVVRTPDALQRRPQAAVSLVGMGATPIGPPAVSVLLDHLDVSMALLVLATPLAALAIVAVLEHDAQGQQHTGRVRCHIRGQPKQLFAREGELATVGLRVLGQRPQVRAHGRVQQRRAPDWSTPRRPTARRIR